MTNTDAVTVTINPVNAVDDLYCKYPNESSPQPVELSLDIRSGALRCDYDPNIGGGSTFDHRHRLILSARIPCLTAAAANHLMQEVAPLAQRVLDGASKQWDGNNTVGRFTDDANAAWDEIVEAIEDRGDEEGDQVIGWEVADWFSEGDQDTIESLGIDADTTDQGLADLAADEVLNATSISACGHAVLAVDEVMEYFTRLRAELREKVREDIEDAAEAIEAAEGTRDALIRRVRGWGERSDTWRTLGELAGISHTEVGRIINNA